MIPSDSPPCWLRFTPCVLSGKFQNFLFNLKCPPSRKVRLISGTGSMVWHFNVSHYYFSVPHTPLIHIPADLTLYSNFRIGPWNLRYGSSKPKSLSFTSYPSICNPSFPGVLPSSPLSVSIVLTVHYVYII